MKDKYYLKFLVQPRAHLLYKIPGATSVDTRDALKKQSYYSPFAFYEYPPEMIPKHGTPGKWSHARDCLMCRHGWHVTRAGTSAFHWDKLKGGVPDCAHHVCFIAQIGGKIVGSPRSNKIVASHMRLLARFGFKEETEQFIEKEAKELLNELDPKNDVAGLMYGGVFRLEVDYQDAMRICKESMKAYEAGNRVLATALEQYLSLMLTSTIYGVTTGSVFYTLCGMFRYLDQRPLRARYRRHMQRRMEERVNSLSPYDLARTWKDEEEKVS